MKVRSSLKSLKTRHRDCKVVRRKGVVFVINKTDLAPYVGANLEIMESDTKRMRPTRPFVLTNLKTKAGLDQVISFIEEKGMLKA